MNSTINWTVRGIAGIFLAGLFAILPLAITVTVLGWVVNFLTNIVGPDSWFGRALGTLGGQLSPNPILAQLIGWALVIGVVFVVGLFVQMKLRSVTVNLVDAIFKRIPLIGSVYGTAAQFVGMLNKKGDNELKGMAVVYCSFGEAGGCGLLALMPSAETYRFGERDYQAVYIPTSPVPMTGGLLLVPADCVTVLDMSVDKLMSIYLSMGATAPTMMPGRAAEAPSASPEE